MGVERIEFLLDAKMNVGNVISEVGRIQKELKGLTIPKGISQDLEKSFGKLGPLLKDYQRQLDKGFSSQKDLNNFNLLREKVGATFDEIKNKINEVNGKEVRLKTDMTAITKMENELNQATSRIQKNLDNLYKTKSGQSESSVLTNLTRLQDGINPSRFSAIARSVEEISNSFKGGNYADFNHQLDGLLNRFNQLKDTSKINIASSLGLEFKTVFEQGSKSAIDYTKTAENATKAMANFITETQVNKMSANNIEKARQDVERLSSTIQQANTDALTNGLKAIGQTSGSIDQVATLMHNIGVAGADAASGILSMKSQVDQLKTSTQYFFSLRNMINLFKRGVREAVETVKDLDKAMTATAVVTKFDVGDMWEKLPEYTANANALGATVQDMYESTTLYYQQGLNTEQAMSIAAETMKMARIAGLDAADATDKMTAALRGFNMEINEASAQRINDVYSNLAAKTASNTEELGTAMQRTASIAHSAGMSFEGTAAFLAQAIETTREPAENIGTAMKTVIARMQEMKKNPLEISEVDGEEVDYNKVDAALKSIGVSLQDVNGNFRDNDKVLLEISQRWDSLSQTQQRYVATTIAGSRQQSRFIAMVSDYERTMQLMGYANNSAGASEEQFGKTLESLEAKLNKLQNAWKAFLMGISNNTFVKGAVDGLTNVLTVTNKLIDTFSLGSKTIKSVLSLFTAFTTLKMGGRLINSLIGGLGGFIDPNTGFMGGFNRGFIGSKASGNAALASQIYSPIVAELRALRGLQAQQIGAANQQRMGAYEQYNRFASARSGLSSLVANGKAYSLTDVQQQLSGLTSRNQNLLMRGNAGTAYNLTNSILSNYTNGKLSMIGPGVTSDKNIVAGLKNSERFLNDQRKAGQLSWEQYFNGISDPKILKRAVDRSVGNGKYEGTYQYLDALDKQISKEAAVRTTNSDVATAFKERYDDLLSQDIDKTKIGEQLKEEGWGQKFKDEQYKQRQNIINSQQQGFQNSKFANVLNGLGYVGTGITQAGMGIQAFAGILTSSANPALQMFGSVLSSVGGLITALGMGISGVSSAMTALASTSAISGLASSLGVSAMALTGGATAIVGAIAGIVAVFKYTQKKAREAGEKVVKDYEEANDKISTGLSNIQQWKEELPRLQEGVDEYGNNINLDTSDYDRYREIMNGIAELNPSIVAGYNAQGDAIIRNNAALDETLAKLQQEQKQLIDTYTDPVSLNKLIKARNANENWHDDGLINESKNAALELVRTMQEAHIPEQVLEAMGLSYEKLSSGDNAAIQSFINNHEQIAQEVARTYARYGAEIPETVMEGLTDFSSLMEGQEEAIQPIIDNLMTLVGTKYKDLMSDLTPELQESFNKSLKLIARSDLGAVQMQNATRELANRYKYAAQKGSEYYNIQKQITDEQKKYGETLNAEDYQKAVGGTDGYATKLEQLADKERKLADEATTAEERMMHLGLAEMYANSAAKALDFTTKKVQDLSKVFNSLQDSMTAAAGAYEDWQKRNEGITGPEEGVNAYKQIYDEVFKETEDENGVKHQYNIEALGRPELWTAAEQILGRENILNKSTEQVVEQLEKFKPLFQEGQDGAVALGQTLADSLAVDDFKKEFGDLFSIEDGMFSVNGDITPEVIDKLAEYYHIDPTALTAAFGNMFQYLDTDAGFAFDVMEARSGFATDSRAVVGATDSQHEGLTDIIVGQDTLIDTLHESNIYNAEQISGIISDLRTEAGVVTAEQIFDDVDGFLENSSKTAAAELEKAYGITSDNFIQSLAPFMEGEEEVKERGTELYGEDWWTQGGEQQYQDWYEGQQTDLEIGEEIPSIESSVSNIEGMLSSYLVSEGKATDLSDIDRLNNAVTGKEGVVDTAVDRLKAGTDNTGEKLTKEQYEQDYNTAQQIRASLEQTKAQLEQGLSTMKEDDPLYETYKNRLDTTNKNLGEIDDALASAQGLAANNEWDTSYDNVAQQVQQLTSSNFGEIFKNLDISAINADPNLQADLALVTKGLTEGITTNESEAFYAALDNLDVDQTMDNQQVYDAFLQHIADMRLKADEEAKQGIQDGANAADVGGTIGEGVKTIADTTTQAIEGSLDEVDVSGTESKAQEVATLLSTGIQSVNDAILSAANNVPTVTPDQTNVSNAQVGAIKPEVDITDANSKLGELKQTGEETKSSIEGPVSLDVTVPGAEKIKQAAKDAQKLKGAQGNTNVSVNASVSGTDKVQGLNKAAKEAQGLNSKAVSYTANVSGTSNVWNAVSAGQSFQGLHDHKVTYTTEYKTIGSKPPYTGGYITPAGVLYRAKGGIAEHPAYPKKGTDRIPAYLTPGEYVQNRKAVQYFGIDFMRHINHRDLTGALQSFGSAAKGTKSQYGQVGPRGKGGPTLTGEMGFEIAWIPSENRSMILGAHGPQMVDLPSDAVVYTHEQSKKIIKQKSIPAGSHSTTGKLDLGTGSGGGGGGGGGGSDKKTKKDKKDDKKDKKTSNKGYKVYVWWENQVRKVDAVTRKMDKAADNFNKLIKRMGTTRAAANKSLAAYKKTINQTISYNKLSLKQANKELKNLDTNKNRKQTIKWGKDKKEKISLAGYIKYDKKTGTYVIDQNAINKVAAKDGDKAKAIKEAAEKEINDRVSKQKSAEDAKKKAQDALNELSNQMYETFGRWEKSINRIYLLSQRLEVLTKQIENAGSRVELELDKIKAIGSDDSSYDKIINALKAETDSMTEKARAESANLDAVIQDFKDSLNLKTYYQIYQKDPNSTAAKDDFFAAKRALMLLEESSVKNPDGSYNYKAVLDALNNAGYSKEKYEAIKGVIDKIFEKQNAVYDTINEAYGSVAELYQRMEEMQSFISDFESELLSGLEEQTQQEINKLEKLNDSLTDALKDLLDEVKEKLEERRKAEDNKKTESDISKKQQRLNLLRADTSGSHATEIAQLEKELADARQDYQRSLEDQLLDKLQKQGDEAAKQRERQIKLLDAQRAIAQATGVDIATVKEWMKNPETYKADMREAWLAGKGYEDAGPAEREQLEQEFEATFAQFRGYQNELANLDTITSILEKIAQSIDNRNTSDNTTADPIVSGKDIKAKGWTAAQARKAGYQAKTLYGAGYSAKEIHDAGYSAKEFKEGTGLSAADAIKAGYSGKEVAAAYGASAAMIGANVSGKAAQAGSGASAKELQEIVNKSKDDKATQADMAGVSVGKVTIDTNGSKKGGNKTINDAHISADGHTVGANIGSTLYTADWDEKTGTIKGKWKKIPIDKLTPALIKKYPIDGKQALERAIENTGIGKKINGSFKSLVTAANIIGKAYKLSNGIYGSISQDGWIFYNKGKEGVYKWNPSKSTKPAFEKYNKSNFIKKAKYKNVGREYAQVLKANKVKGYKTGGLADYTGPAWLDGTKSKPELVLNAQDTKNFLALKDVLSHVMSSTTNLNNTYGGDMNFDININVDHINNDYDVDKIADRIKKKIVQDSSYRNVTQVRKFR